MTRSPLLGVKVLDLSRAISGPYAGRILSDLGADVVKVDPPEGDVANLFGRVQSGRSGLFAQMNAGKRTIALDLNDPEARTAARSLAGAADVVIENFRVGVIDRLGLAYDDLTKEHPDLVMLSLSGFGATSPESGRRAFAPVIHAESGALVRHANIHGHPNADFTTSNADTVSALHGVIAVLAALRQRDVTGTGAHIDLSMLHAVLASDDQAHWVVDEDDGISENWGRIYDGVDGPVLLAMNARGIWRNVSQTTGLEDGLPSDAPIPLKSERRDERIREWLTSFPSRDEMLAELDRCGIGWADVLAPEQVLSQATFVAEPPYDEVGDGGDGTRRIVRMPYRIGDWHSHVPGPVPSVEDQLATVLLDWQQ